jgi:hypothetical protein
MVIATSVYQPFPDGSSTLSATASGQVRQIPLIRTTFDDGGAKTASTVESEQRQSLSYRIWQYYSRQINATVVSVAIFGVLYLWAGPYLSSIPQDGFSTVATMFATLLGLTFAAFSIVTALMPSVPSGIVATRTFLMFAETFVFTMWLQLATLLAAGVCYLAYGAPWVAPTGVLVIFGALMSTAFLLVVVHYMFYIFKLVRMNLAGDSAPARVL